MKYLKIKYLKNEVFGGWSFWKNEVFEELIYLPYSKERPTMADGHSSKAFLNSDVREKMLQRVERSNLLVLELESSGVVVVNGN